jgi:hypothetical protein
MKMMEFSARKGEAKVSIIRIRQFPTGTPVWKGCSPSTAGDGFFA